MEGHVGTSPVLATIRQKFWVLQDPEAVKRVMGECLICKRWNSCPESQIMAPLPDVRVTPAQPPFSSVGIDYFGPIPWKVQLALSNDMVVYLHVLRLELYILRSPKT